jgi:glyoxylase-like metal-dependent hydrolase (beta-lactamase superfamily II)
VKVQAIGRFVQPKDSNPAKLHAMSEAPSLLAPGVHRLGNALVNCFLVEDGNRMTLVDGGLPAFRRQLNEYLRSLGRSVADIDAVILTHAHGDHVGIVESVRTDAPATVHVHEADAGMARTGKVHKRDGSLLPYFRYPATWKLFYVGGKAGVGRTPNVTEMTTFNEPVDLDVPGRPRIVPTPGHSPGHVCFHLPDRGVLIVGDALCTYNPLTGTQLMPRAFAFDALQALASLRAIERIDAGLTLPGHGEPWTDGPAAAVARAREVGLT